MAALSKTPEMDHPAHGAVGNAALAAFVAGLPPAQADARTSPPEPTEPAAAIRDLPLRQQDEIVWLARCIYSETKRPHEQELVAWVVRNRVETSFRGENYRDVVLNPKQFTAFNRPTATRKRILNLDLNSSAPGWKQALRIAHKVYTASPEERPFSATTRHFYSPISRTSGLPPKWALNEDPLSAAALDVNPNRFKFYEDIVRQPGQTSPVSLPPDLKARASASHHASNGSGSQALQRIHRRIERRRGNSSIRRPARPKGPEPPTVKRRD